MIKYYKELEKPNDFYLPLVEKKCWSRGSIKVERIDLPSGFFDKYRYLLNTIQDVDFLIINIDLKKINNKLTAKWHYDELTKIDYDLYQADYIILDDLREIKEDMPELKKILKTPKEIIPLLQFYSRALSLVMQLCPEIEGVWKKISFQLISALKDIENYSTIKYEEPVEAAKNVKLPNAWYITSYGDLYNTGGKRGHKETNLIYPYESITRSFLENQSIEGIKDGLLSKRLKIINNGYIDKFDFVDYLNYIYDIPSIQTSNNYRFLDERSYELRIVKTILGVVSAEAGLYRFFEDIQKYTFNPKRELYRLKDMVRDDMGDILVRGSGFYKIESIVNKTITTSSLKPFEDLYEYIIRGWNVCMIPPIIINREEGVVEELDTNSPIVEKYIDSDIKKYDKCKQKGYGKLY